MTASKPRRRASIGRSRALVGSSTFPAFSFIADFLWVTAAIIVRRVGVMIVPSDGGAT